MFLRSSQQFLQRNLILKSSDIGHLHNGGDLNPGEQHSRVTRDDGTVTFCALCAATVLSRDRCADFGRPLTKKVMSHSRDGPGVTAPLQTNIVPLTVVWNPPLLKKSPMKTFRIWRSRKPLCPLPLYLSTMLLQKYQQQQQQRSLELIWVSTSALSDPRLPHCWVHQNRASPFASDFSPQPRNGNQFCPF